MIAYYACCPSELDQPANRVDDLPAMSAIDPNQFSITPSPQDLLDEGPANTAFGQGASAAAGTQAPEEPPQEKALDALNDYTESAQAWVNKEHELGVPEEYLTAHEMTSTLVGGVIANGTEALAAAAQKLQPQTVLALLQQ